MRASAASAVFRVITWVRDSRARAWSRLEAWRLAHMTSLVIEIAIGALPALAPYMEAVRSHVDGEAIKRAGLKIAIDPGNGVAASR